MKAILLAVFIAFCAVSHFGGEFAEGGGGGGGGGEEDLYKLLTVERSATAAQIKKAYKKLSLQYHPDKNKGDKEAEEMFIRITDAYDVLSDEEKKAAYDKCGMECVKNQQAGQGGGGGGGFNVFDPFKMFFGGGQNQQQQEEQKGPDLKVTLSVSLEDLYNGKIAEVLIDKQVRCPFCRGSGAKDASDVHTCNECGGKGIKTITQQIAPGFVQQMQTTCPKCNGKGKIAKSKCPHCKGEKIARGEEELLIDIEKGMTDGQEIKFQGKGDDHPDHLPGDVIFKIRANPHPYFERKGNDLWYKSKISLVEALYGFEKTITHLDGHIVKYSSNGQVIRPSQVIQLAGEGMPVYQQRSKGSLFIEFEVVFPQTLSQDQKNKIRDVLSS